MTSVRSDRRRAWSWGATAVVVAAVLGFHQLGTDSLWLDEVYSVEYAHFPWAPLYDLFAHQDPNMSLYYLLLKGWMRLWGDGEFAVRSLSVLFAIGGVVTLYLAASRLLSREVGGLASLLLATNASYIAYAQEARSYSLLLFLVCVSMYCFVRAVESRALGWWLALGTVNALILFTHLFGTFALLAQAVALVLLPRGTLRLQNLAAALITFGALSSPLVIPVLSGMSQVRAQGSWAAAPSLDTIKTVLNQLVTGGPEPDSLVVAILLLLAAGIAAGLLRRGDRQNIWRIVLPICWMIAPVAGLLALSLSVPAFVPRYMLPAIPAMCIVAAIGLSSLRWRPLAVVLTLALALLSTRDVVTNYYPAVKDEWRPSTHAVTDQAQAGDAVLFFSGAGQLPFEYYYRLLSPAAPRLVSVYPRPFGTPLWNRPKVSLLGPNDAEMAELAQHFPRLWVVVAYDVKSYGWDSNVFLGRVEQHFSRKEEHQFHNVRVLLYETRRESLPVG